MNFYDDPVTLECKSAAQQWLQSKDPLIQDFGARLLCLLCSKQVTLSTPGPHMPHIPPRDLIPEEFESYPWGPGVFRGGHEHLKLPLNFPSWASMISMPLREFWALEAENVGLRLGVFWASPHWRYLPHACESLDLHHRLRGSGIYFTQKSELEQLEFVPVAPGDVYLHLPSDIYGFESGEEPLLNLWAERIVDVQAVPRVIRDLQEVADDPVTRALQVAAHQWLQAEDQVVQLFGKKTKLFLRPRDLIRQVPEAAPPQGKISAEFRGCPWYPSLAYTNCMDPKLKPLRDCILYEEGDTMFGMFFAPAGTYYPAHRHQPWEIYHMIEGEGLFFLGDDGGEPAQALAEVDQMEAKPLSIFSNGPGCFWLHRPYQSHGMQLLDRPALILWGWIGDLSGDYDLRYLEKDIFLQCCKTHAKSRL